MGALCPHGGPRGPLLSDRAGARLPRELSPGGGGAGVPSRARRLSAPRGLLGRPRPLRVPRGRSLVQTRLSWFRGLPPRAADPIPTRHPPLEPVTLWWHHAQPRGHGLCHTSPLTWCVLVCILCDTRVIFPKHPSGESRFSSTDTCGVHACAHHSIGTGAAQSSSVQDELQRKTEPPQRCWAASAPVCGPAVAGGCAGHTPGPPLLLRGCFLRSHHARLLVGPFAAGLRCKLWQEGACPLLPSRGACWPTVRTRAGEDGVPSVRAGRGVRPSSVHRRGLKRRPRVGALGRLWGLSRRPSRGASGSSAYPPPPRLLTTVPPTGPC